MTVPIDLSGRVILVCGVARGGIGGATAQRLAAAGASVFAVDKSQVILDEAIADVEAAGGRCAGMVADLMDPTQRGRVVPAAAARFERLDGVTNVAGGTRAGDFGRLEDTPLALFREMLNLNLEYVFEICRDAAKLMIERGSRGSLVNVSSLEALSAALFHGPYGAAKNGMIALTRTMAVEWRAHGVRANTVSPGAVATQRSLSRRGATVESMAREMTIVTPEEVASTIMFLLSDLSSGVNGQNLVVDGGRSANYPMDSYDALKAILLKDG